MRNFTPKERSQNVSYLQQLQIRNKRNSNKVLCIQYIYYGRKNTIQRCSFVLSGKLLHYYSRSGAGGNLLWKLLLYCASQGLHESVPQRSWGNIALFFRRCYCKILPWGLDYGEPEKGLGELLENVSGHRNRGNPDDMVYLDFRKAVDNVSPKALENTQQSWNRKRDPAMDW